jgi:putative transport protein
MGWLIQLHATQPVAHAIGILAIVAVCGMALGSVTVRAIKLGTALAVLLAWALGIDLAGGLGVLSGVTTNTTSLGAAQQSLATLPHMSEDRLALPALAYAVTYPAAVVAILGTLLLLKVVFHIDTKKEAELFTAERQRNN